MRTPRAEPRHALLLALLAAAATAVLLATSGKGQSRALAPATSAASWRGLVGSRPRVALGERVIVVLRTPSLAQRVAAAGGIVATEKERGWTKAVLSAERLLVSRLALQGVVVHPDFTYARVLAGFSALVDASAIPIIERDNDVSGVYPVRVAYPASLSTRVLSSPDFGPGSGHRPDVGMSGIDGRGVTIALLDTGVDPAVPYLRGRVQQGIDIVGGSPDALAATNPDDPTAVERHGTEMAGLLVGAGGPSGLTGVATEASVLPIRIAGWQPDSLGHYAIYARSDQIIAGLERAVDPNDDGDAHDAARIALVALAEPFASFADGPEAQAVQGALDLDTLVVAPAGNDGAAAAGFGDVSAPGSSPDALTVGALDARVETGQARVIVRAGLSTLLDDTTPLVGAARPPRGLDLRIAVPRGTLRGTRRTAPRLEDFFSRTGISLVAGRAALVPAGASPAPAAERAAEAGASAVLLYGATSPLPAGGLGLDENVPVPVISIPTATARAALHRIAQHQPVVVGMTGAALAQNVEDGRVASFSSTGLAFDGRVKPDLVAPGVGLATSDPGANADGSPRFVTVNGSSASAAVVAGAAALLAQARPSLGAGALDGLLVGTAQALPKDPVTAQGAGLVDVGAAAAGEVAASPASLALGRSTGAGWRVNASFTLTNLSTRRTHLVLAVRTQDEGAGAVDFRLRPAAVTLRQGHSVLVHLSAITASAPTGTSTADGSVLVSVQGGGVVRIPWAIAFGAATTDLVQHATLSARSFALSDAKPALLSIDAGRVLDVSGRPEIEPVSLLDVDLQNADGASLGLLARLRDVLPGRYTFGITGRGPNGNPLPAGTYILRVVAHPMEPGPPDVRRLVFTLR
ncbi:MAG TPA: S8 family serine peptidase [Gaiellaceae bacterium]|nr:S8 family serine peptidase [Gaiellaceae bacterium]